MKRLSVVMLAGIVTTVLGCGSSHQPAFQVSSSDFDLDPLVGRWAGDYTVKENGRTGTIAFTLGKGDSFAEGEVVMMPRNAVATGSAADRAGVTSASAPVSREILKIQFMRKEGGNLVGTLNPYTDPECRCRVATTFEGRFVDARTIEGTFVTKGVQPGRAPTGGEWKVTRLKKL